MSGSAVDPVIPLTTIVLLPGMDGTGNLFAPFVDALPAGLQAEIVRYPTDRWLDDAALLEHARSRLPRNGPFILLGESFSGPVALALAAEQPPGLQSVVLCASFARYPNRALAGLAPAMSMLPLHALPKRLLGWPLLGRFAAPALRDALHSAVHRVAEHVMAKRSVQVMSFDERAAAARLRVPLLYLRATEDRVVARSAARELSRVVPDCKIVDIEAPHMLLQCAPDQAARALVEFVHQR